MSIQSFSCNETEQLFTSGITKKFNSIKSTAERKLSMLDSAKELIDLQSPPGNRLHELKHNRSGQHAISINDQYRICFTWTQAGPDKVEITDYH